MFPLFVTSEVHAIKSICIWILDNKLSANTPCVHFTPGILKSHVQDQQSFSTFFNNTKNSYFRSGLGVLLFTLVKQ